MDSLMIKMDDLEYFYDKNQALSINHLSIKKGITTVFLGSNGSGKTTILKMLSGLIYPSRGVMNNTSEELEKKSVMVHQVPYMFSGTVKYNIDFVLKNKKIKKDNRIKIINNVLKQADLFHLIQRKASELSGGEKQRLAIARAISVDPENLILDEPFAHIDIKSRELIAGLIFQRAELQKTTILSTHDLTSAYRLADRIIYLEDGKIKEPEYNFFKGNISHRDDHFCSFYSQSEKGNITIFAPASEKDHKAVVIPYRDIFLTRDKIESSAQNQLSGEIVLLRKSGSQFFVTIDCGLELKAVITDLSVKKFQLKEKKKIYVNFKASAVRLY